MRDRIQDRKKAWEKGDRREMRHDRKERGKDASDNEIGEK